MHNAAWPGRAETEGNEPSERQLQQEPEVQHKRTTHTHM